MRRFDAIDVKAGQGPGSDGVSAAAVVLGIAYLLATAGCLLVQDLDRIATLGCVGNALALALLLRLGTRYWPAALAFVFLTGLIAGLAGGGDPAIALGVMAANVIEIGVVAWLIRRLCGTDLVFDTEVAPYLRVQAVAVVIAPAIGAAIAALVLYQTGQFDRFSSIWPRWTGAAMGALVVLPVALSMSRERLRQTFTGTRSRRVRSGRGNDGDRDLSGGSFPSSSVRPRRDPAGCAGPAAQSARNRVCRRGQGDHPDRFRDSRLASAAAHRHADPQCRHRSLLGLAGDCPAVRHQPARCRVAQGARRAGAQARPGSRPSCSIRRSANAWLKRTAGS